MRILVARLLVVVTGLLIVSLAILFAVIRNTSDDAGAATRPQATVVVPGADVPVRSNQAIGQIAQASLVARGRAVYAEQRCRACHSIEGEGNTRSVLDGVGSRLTEREIRLWIVAPQQMNPAVMKRAYQLPAADLDALVAYLRSR